MQLQAVGTSAVLRESQRTSEMAKCRRKRIRKDHTVPPVFAYDEWRGIAEAFELSPRQAQILGLVIQSHKDREIGKSLKIGHSTVRTHLIETRKRLSAADRMALAYRVFVAFRELIEPTQNNPQENANDGK